MASTMIKYMASLKAPDVSGLVGEEGEEPVSEAQTKDDDDARIAQQEDITQRHKRNNEEREKLRNEIRKKYGLKNPNDENKDKINKFETQSLGEVRNNDPKKSECCCTII